MKSGRKTRVVNAKIRDEIMVPEFAKETGKSTSFCKSTTSSMGQDLLISDPYEDSLIKCRHSSIENAGEGVFALTDIKVKHFIQNNATSVTLVDQLILSSQVKNVKCHKSSIRTI